MMVITSLSRDYHQVKKDYHLMARLPTAMVIVRKMARWQLEGEAVDGSGGAV